MYETHFGFHRQPFHSADASRAFFVSESIRTILPQLLHALRSDLGIAVLTGVPGSGKTSLLRYVQRQLSNEGRVFVCSGASLGTSTDLIGVLLQASRVRAGSESPTKSNGADAGLPATRSSAMEHMRRTAELWGPILLLIDDAQLIPLAVLNELRAVTEEEWNGRDLVRCLVSAPISFEEQLARSEYAEFGRRIRCHAFLQPFKSVESVRFLQEQIELAGGRLSQVLTGSALELIAMAADGIPRCLSLLADETLIVAAECGEKTATEQSVRTALSRLQHLQYNWNASPHAENSESPLSDDDDTADVPITPAASPTRSAIGSRSAPACATLSHGVIEFGGPSGNAADIRPATQSPERSIMASQSSAVEPRIEAAIHEEDSGVSLLGEPTSSSEFEFGIPQSIDEFVRLEPVAITNEASALFEVGRRFFAESSEDCISIEDVDDSDIVNLLNPDGEFDREPWNVNTFTDTTSSFVSINALSASDQPAEEPIVAESKRTANFTFIDLDDSRMSNRTPVFDRYTWIALGREFPPGAGWSDSQPDAAKLMLADCGMLATNQLATLCLQTASMRQMASINQILITPTEDSILIDEILNRLPSREEGSSELYRNVLVNDEASPAFSGLKIWRDGQLIMAHSVDSDPPDATDAAPRHFGTIEDAVDETERQQPEPGAKLVQGGFFTLPVPNETVVWDLKSPEISIDHDVFPIVESVTNLRADLGEFQQSGRITGSDPGGIERVVSPDAVRTPGADTLISRAKRRLDERTLDTDSAVIALQMAPAPRSRRATSGAEDSEVISVAGNNPGSGPPQFSRLFTRLWENRRRAADQAEAERRG